jgi:uncharacterized membrane protein (DUF485 family)
LLVNYARWLMGDNFAVIGAALFLLLYQVFPTLAAFAVDAAWCCFAWAS